MNMRITPDIPLIGFPTWRFTIVKSPRFPRLQQILDGLSGISILGGLCLLIVLLRHTGLTLYPPHWLSGVVFYSVLSVSLLLIGWGIGKSFVQQWVKPATRYTPIGYLDISGDGMTIILTEGGEQVYGEAAFKNLHRIDCFFGMGIRPQKHRNASTFEEIAVIRMSLKGDFGVVDYFVLNTLEETLDDEIITQHGAFHHYLLRLKGADLTLHQRIQFWDKF